MNFFEKVYYVCNLIPIGKVASYGQIAAMIGNPKAARQVGWALSRGPEGKAIPAHRVVNRKGELSGAAAFLLEKEQESKLYAEGVVVVKNQIDLKIYGWKPNQAELKSISFATRG